MVVKNVAGLDMSKLMIGSFGTLAAIAVVNFKLIPQPPCLAIEQIPSFFICQNANSRPYARGRQVVNVAVEQQGFQSATRSRSLCGHRPEELHNQKTQVEDPE